MIFFTIICFWLETFSISSIYLHSLIGHTRLSILSKYGHVVGCYLETTIVKPHFSSDLGIFLVQPCIQSTEKGHLE